MEMKPIQQRSRKKAFCPGTFDWTIPVSRRIAVAALLVTMKVTSALHDVKVTIPKVVASGGVATLGCRWTLDDGETLYSVKWYRSRQEFYRYLPKEMPHTRVFTHEGINVDLSRSGEHEIVLQELMRNLTGHYGCEVSADAPSFHTEQTSSYMHIVDLPESDPVVVVEKMWYSPGDILRANCSAPPADPPAEITWMINGRLVNGTPLDQLLKISALKLAPFSTSTIAPFTSTSAIPVDSDNHENNTSKGDARVREEYDVIVRSHQSKHARAGWKRRPSVSVLEIRVLPDFFVKGKVTLSCVASVHTIYSAKTELELQEEKPQIASVLGTRDTAAGGVSLCKPFKTLLTIILLTHKSFLRRFLM